MELKRKPFQGVLNILSFNRHFYVIGLSMIVLLLLSRLLIDWNIILFWTIVISFLYGLIMPLIVSAYVYDFSGYYNFKWLKDLNILNSNNKHIVNINAGFDETSFILKSKFPNTNLQVFDFYNPEKHTEAAIVRARKVSLLYPDTKQMTTSAISLKDKSVDMVFLLSAAHEIRSNKEKISFLKECKRICKPNAQVILVEHLRDIPNFFAFSIGFTHFFSKKTWINAFKSAGFNSYTETKFTPFMSIFKFN
ncbi:methyltransferase domain-containing protein [uncultured Algibacter sp.]|uniref:methyltransferase domain-containing protein n=1 Tax=uncultured Algibacter sp. TaxID=298659 RepID=UPI0026319711|nr:methyltransferase domain-containing protein [uncultured Algibacter sp.]